MQVFRTDTGWLIAYQCRQCTEGSEDDMIDLGTYHIRILRDYVRAGVYQDVRTRDPQQDRPLSAKGSR